MTISIIIPTMNRANLLRRTLDSLVRMDGNKYDFEIIVIDNGSTDITKNVVQDFSARSTNIRYIYEPTPGLMSARHRGIRESHGEILAFIDDDVVVDKSWLIAINEVFANQFISLAGGPSLPIFEANKPSWLDDLFQENDRGRFCLALSLIDGGKKERSVSASYIFGLNYRAGLGNLNS